MSADIPYPAITVLMSVFNSEAYLREAIDSVLNQTFKNFEFLIINDASTDKSNDILNSYSDHRMVILQNKINIGLTKSLNKGVSIAKGKYIARMDADDICYKNRLKIQFHYMETHPEIGICGTWMKCFNNQGVQSISKFPEHHNQILAHLLFASGFGHPTVIFRKNIPDLKYNETFTVAQDYELWHRILRNTKGANLSKVLLKYRLSETKIGTINLVKQTEIADFMRISVLNSLGFDLSEGEKEYHLSLLHNNWGRDNQKFLKSINWFINIINQNKLTRQIDESVLSETIAKYCFFKCTSTKKYSNYKIYRNSDLIKYYQPTLLEKMKLIVKSIIDFTKYFLWKKY